LAIDPARPIDPSEEMFPEGPNPGIAVSDSLCLSRYEFFKNMKRLLYACKNRHFSVQKTWRELWTYFIKSLTETAYLYIWYDGIKIATAWKGFERQDKFQDFLFGPAISPYWPALTTWYLKLPMPPVEDADYATGERSTTTLGIDRVDTLSLFCGATLKHETIAFFNALSWVLELFHKFVIRKGVKHDSTNYQWWGRFQEVNSRADLSDKTECPICFSDYTFHSEITAALLPSDPRPVKLSCNHIMCLPCLRQWTVENSSNSDKCPTCRGTILPQSNPQEQYYEHFADRTITAYEIPECDPRILAKLVIEATDDYLSYLPDSITGVREDTKWGPNALYYAWRNNFLSSDTSIPLVYGSGLPQLTRALKCHDAKCWIALHYLHWSCERLRDFLAGDSTRFRKACESQQYCYARMDSLDLILSCLCLERDLHRAGIVDADGRERPREQQGTPNV
jgi:uncharacterized CHY-type Zn-finger protein